MPLAPVWVAIVQEANVKGAAITALHAIACNTTQFAALAAALAATLAVAIPVRYAMLPPTKTAGNSNILAIAG
jgi:hypothetical protein